MRGRLELLMLLCTSVALMGCDEGPSPNAKAKPVLKAPGPVDPDAPEQFTTTDSGLKYRIRRKSGGTKPVGKQQVVVNYRGWLDNGEVFDSSYGTGGVPGTFDVETAIPGFAEGVQLIGEGAMIELDIPYQLAYGEEGRPPVIPPKTGLHFLIELIKVQDPPKPPTDLAGAESNPPEKTKPGKVDEDAPEEFTTLPSGLKYRIRRKSNGKKPLATDQVLVNYRGWLDNGSVFDTSYAAQPISFKLNDVVKGWGEGLQLIGVGGMIELEIPPDLGYGREGRPPKIPANSTLHFIVELLDVKQ